MRVCVFVCNLGFDYKTMYDIKRYRFCCVIYILDSREFFYNPQLYRVGLFVKRSPSSSTSWVFTPVMLFVCYLAIRKDKCTHRQPLNTRKPHGGLPFLGYIN